MGFNKGFFDSLPQRIEEYKSVFGWNKMPSVILRAHGRDYYLLWPRIDEGTKDNEDSQTITFVYHDKRKAVPIPENIQKKQEMKWNHAWPAVTVAYRHIEAVIFDASGDGKPGYKQPQQNRKG